MKVLKKGRPQKGWSKEFLCTGDGNGGGGCGAKLLVEQADLYQTSHSDYGGDTDYFVTFCCPSCGVETDAKGTPFYGVNLPKRKPKPPVTATNWL
jgi:hypothetical protein